MDFVRDSFIQNVLAVILGKVIFSISCFKKYVDDIVSIES